MHFKRNTTSVRTKPLIIGPNVHAQQCHFPLFLFKSHDLSKPFWRALLTSQDTANQNELRDRSTTDMMVSFCKKNVICSFFCSFLNFYNFFQLYKLYGSLKNAPKKSVRSRFQGIWSRLVVLSGEIFEPLVCHRWVALLSPNYRRW